MLDLERDGLYNKIMSIILGILLVVLINNVFKITSEPTVSEIIVEVKNQ